MLVNDDLGDLHKTKEVFRAFGKEFYNINKGPAPLLYSAVISDSHKIYFTKSYFP
jgi:hypothetical protein